MQQLGIDAFIWMGILLCVSQSAIFSGCNLAVFSLSRLGLEVELEAGNRHAPKILALRRDSNFLLTTILWGNVGVNVLLTLLSDSVLAGAAAFLFSTVVITLFGEIVPQAYFSRNALKVAGLLAPLLRVYQVILYPVAKPTAMLLDVWLGKESTRYLGERHLHAFILKHVESPDAKDINRLEGMGALNFLTIDDVPIKTEGTPLDTDSIFSLPYKDSSPVFPRYQSDPSDPFLAKIEASQNKWLILTDEAGEPRHALDADGFLRRALFDGNQVDPAKFCHRPVIVRSSDEPVGSALSKLRFSPSEQGEQIIENDIILLWSEQRRIITGNDILGRLMQGILGPAQT